MGFSILSIPPKMEYQNFHLILFIKIILNHSKFDIQSQTFLCYCFWPLCLSKLVGTLVNLGNSFAYTRHGHSWLLSALCPAVWLLLHSFSRLGRPAIVQPDVLHLSVLTWFHIWCSATRQAWALLERWDGATWKLWLTGQEYMALTSGHQDTAKS